MKYQIIIPMLFLLSSIQAQDGTIQIATKPDKVGDLICVSNKVTPSQTEGIQVMYWTRHDGIITNHFGTRDNPEIYQSFCTSMLADEMEVHRCYRKIGHPDWESIPPSNSEFAWIKSGDITYRIECSQDTIRDTIFVPTIVRDTVNIPDEQCEIDLQACQDSIRTLLDSITTQAEISPDTVFQVIEIINTAEVDALQLQLDNCRLDLEDALINLQNCTNVQYACNVWVAPNPIEQGSSAIAYLETELGGKNARVQILDFNTGATVWTQMISDVQKGITELYAPFEDLETGMYLFRVEFDAGGYILRGTEKIIII